MSAGKGRSDGLDVLERYRFEQARISNRYQRGAAQKKTEQAEKQPADSQQCGQIQQLKVDSITMKAGHDQPVEIHIVHGQEPAGRCGEFQAAALDFSREQKKEREGKMPGRQSERDRPGAVCFQTAARAAAEAQLGMLS